MDIKCENGLMAYKFKVGDEVITTEGVRGKIIDICTCSACFSRGFYEPTWVSDENEHDRRYITIYEAETGFLEYYKIGEYRFNDFDKAEVLSTMASYEREIKRLRKQLRFIEELEVANE